MTKSSIRYGLFGLFVSLIIFFSSQTFAYYPFLYFQQFFEDINFNIRYALEGSGHQSYKNTVFVDLDDRSIDRFGNFNRFWPRRYLGEIIGNMKKDGASVIFLDSFFRGGRNSFDNQVLADSIRSAANVLTGYYLSSVSKKFPEDYKFEDFFPIRFFPKNKKVDFISAKDAAFSYHELIMSSERGGFTNIIPGKDGVVRHIPLYIKYKNLILPSAAVQIWQYSKGLYPFNGRIISDGIHFGNFFIPADSHAFMRINYHYPDFSERKISFIDVFAGNFKKGTFNKKIVIFGSGSLKINDIKRIPGNRKVPGAEIHAAALETILNGDFLKISPGFYILMLTVVCGIITVIVFLYFHSVLKRFILFSILILIVFFIPLILFIKMSLIVNSAIPVITMIVLASTLSFYKHFHH